MQQISGNRSMRPFIVLAAVGLVFLAQGGSTLVSASLGYSILQQFATLGPIALSLGLTLIIRHFDLSVAGHATVGGCIAVTLGVASPIGGIAAAAIFGLLFGALQGVLIVWLRLGSIGVTLGGLLTLNGFAYVITGNQEISLQRMELAQFVDDPLFLLASPRFLLAAALVVLAGFIAARTRLWPQIQATGSDPQAAVVAGVPTGVITLVIFALSGLLSACAGALLSYSLAAASPTALSNILVPAAAAAIIGGVSLGGGRGHPVGIAGGVLVLCTLQSCLTAIGVKPFAQDIVTGAVLLAVGISDSVELKRRLHDLRRLLPGRTRPRPTSEL